MLNWFKRLVRGSSPTFTKKVIGELNIHSGALLITDPLVMGAPIRLEGIPPGRHEVIATIIQYPEGGAHVARIEMTCLLNGKEKKSLGEVIVDSAHIVLLDERDFEMHWKNEGDERIGITSTPQEHRNVATFIGKQFGLSHHETDFMHSVFDEPISEELEQRINKYLESHPKYGSSTYLYFRVQTQNTREIVADAMLRTNWCTVELDSDSGASLLAVSSGFGDGTYEVKGSFDSNDLLSFELEFIGPKQNKILEAFPHLRLAGPA